ncbi:MAG: serine/threonine-protein kinase [Solirubrobacterales bacterium]
MATLPRPGERVGSYELVGQIGEGGMGSVLRARTADGQDVAIKLVKPELASDQVFRRRFAREVRIASEVRHENLVAVIESGEHDGLPWLAQPYVSGGSLADRLESGHLELAEALKIATGVARGLDAVHRAGLVHRDVKPANILMDADGRPLLADFGLAKDSAATVLTAAGQTVGSMDYMAPEQIKGEEVGPPSDIYALGCAVFECLCGRPPFADRTGLKTLWAHLQDAPPDPASLRSDIPADVCWALMHALAKEPDKRPPTATAYTMMLNAAAGNTMMGGPR